MTSCLLEEKRLGFASTYATGLEIYRAGIKAVLQPPEYHIHGAEEMDLDSELVGGWTNPSEKYESKWETSSPIFGVKIPNNLSNHHLGELVF